MQIYITVFQSHNASTCTTGDDRNAVYLEDVPILSLGNFRGLDQMYMYMCMHQLSLTLNFYVHDVLISSDWS